MNWNFKAMLTVLCVLVSFAINVQAEEVVDYSKLVAGTGGFVNSINKPTVYAYVHAGVTVKVRHFSTTIPFCAVMYFGQTDNPLAYGSEDLTVVVNAEGVLAISCIKNSKSILDHKFLIGVFIDSLHGQFID